jgi:hypothetical protein
MHTKEYHSALIKVNEVPICATIWMELQNMLSKQSQSQKTTDFVISFISNVQNRQIYRDKKK